jgi:hypothetical protein
VELGAPAALVRIVWQWDDFLLLVPRCARFLSIIGAGTEAADRVGRAHGEGNRGVVNRQPTEDVSLQRERLTNQPPGGPESLQPAGLRRRTFTWPSRCFGGTIFQPPGSQTKKYSRGRRPFICSN